MLDPHGIGIEPIAACCPRCGRALWSRAVLNHVDAVTEGGTNADSGLSVDRVASKYTDFSPTGFGEPSPDELLYRRLTRLIAEGLQQLEHASLIRAQMHSSQGHFDYAVIRNGRSLVDTATVAQALGAGQRFRAFQISSQGQRRAQSRVM